jgi:C1A family cysteine protease
MGRYTLSLIFCLVFLSVASKGGLSVAGWHSVDTRLVQATTPAQTPGNESQLQKENDELRKKLDEYKKLEEDIVAQRIAEKARAQVLWWLGFGGLAILVTGALGFKALSDYTKTLVTKSIESITKERLEAEMLAEGQRQVKIVLDNQKEDFLLFAKQQYTHLITSMEPLGAKEALPTMATRKEKRLDYSSEMLPVRNQGEEGSSVAFAFAEALEFQIKKKLKQKVVISPRFIYYLARKRDGTLQMDAGTTLQSAISALKSTGAVPEEAWPYKAGAFQDEPPDAVEHARHYRIKSSVRVNNIEEIKSALETYGPLVTGITIYQSAFGPDVAKTGCFPLPAASESAVGGHALCIVGYDDDEKLLKAKNHWGAGWGDGGYAYIPYAYAERFLSDTSALTLWLTKADLKD